MVAALRLASVSDDGPSDRDQVIYEWVRFQGKTQSEVASLLEVNQATVSRALRRVEQWIARGRPGDAGELTMEERLRVQRWLTFERNERLLTAALRLAHEVERCGDLETTTTSYPLNSPTQEKQLRTEHRQIDRSGLAARYLRLAFRINMEQLKLLQGGILDDLHCQDQGPPTLAAGSYPDETAPADPRPAGAMLAHDDPSPDSPSQARVAQVISDPPELVSLPPELRPQQPASATLPPVPSESPIPALRSPTDPPSAPRSDGPVHNCITPDSPLTSSSTSCSAAAAAPEKKFTSCITSPPSRGVRPASALTSGQRNLPGPAPPPTRDQSRGQGTQTPVGHNRGP